MELIDWAQFAKFLSALIFVLCLMGGLAIAVKLFNKNSPMVPASKKRLKVVEALPLDARRRLLLIKRDDKEHLVILGANSETVIETDIESHQDIDHAQKTEKDD